MRLYVHRHNGQWHISEHVLGGQPILRAGPFISREDALKHLEGMKK
jgi:hypothetical protein